FLFHVEGGIGGKLADYDIASRLSYMLWNTMPDAALFDAAAKGELHSPEGRMKAARRMIDDPRAHQALDEFFYEWLRLDRVENAVKARAAAVPARAAAAARREPDAAGADRREYGPHPAAIDDRARGKRHVRLVPSVDGSDRLRPRELRRDRRVAR